MSRSETSRRHVSDLFLFSQLAGLGPDRRQVSNKTDLVEFGHNYQVALALPALRERGVQVVAKTFCQAALFVVLYLQTK